MTTPNRSPDCHRSPDCPSHPHCPRTPGHPRNRPGHPRNRPGRRSSFAGPLAFITITFALMVGLIAVVQLMRPRHVEIERAAGEPASQADPRLGPPQWDDDEEVLDTRTGERRPWGEIKAERAE